MKLSYRYQAKTASGQVVEGNVVATSRALALLQLRKTGLKPRKVTLDLGRSLTAWRTVEFNQTELSRLYITLGRRLARGKQLAEGLEQALEYITDDRLKQAAIAMRQALIDGQGAAEAMQAAGFPRRDAMMVRATSQAGRTAQAFESLGGEVKRGAALRKSVKSVFYMPTIMLVFMVLFMWGAVSFFAPITMEFLKNAGVASKLSGFLKTYFTFAQAFNTYWIPSSIAYFASFVGLFALLRSKPFLKLFDRWPALRDLSVKSDQAALWNSYLQMYDAAVSGPDAAAMVASAANRADSQTAFERLSAQLAAGASLDSAVVAAGFPKFVIGGISSAVSAGELTQGLRDMVDILEEDVAIVTERFKENVRILSVIVMAVGVLGVFLVTYYPILSSTLSNT